MELKLGVSRSLLGSTWSYPIHGLRHPPTADTSGWYCWTGELRPDGDFFVPIHQHHLVERLPEISDLLAMPPGSRFLIAPEYRDTWHDPSLLEV